MSLTQAVKDEARRLGFALAGVTTPEPPPHLSAYERWLEEGRYASMHYLASERARACRKDPRLILPECRSILVLAARYPAHLPLGDSCRRDSRWRLGAASASPLAPFPAETGGESKQSVGRVAAYAGGRDYHIVFAERLKALAAFVETQVGSPLAQRGYTDTGPILERELAQRAGLGWIGKNTCLINPQQGSYFLLAELFLGVELEPDAPFEPDLCGTCRRCIEACPTGCIRPDRTIDAGRCISYLTIENKGEIPPELRPKLGEWVFGCDICQMVCPWNRFAGEEYDPAFAPRPGLPEPNLKNELRLTPEEFKQKYTDSPLLRSRRGGYLRNVAVALGNRGDPAAIAALEEALNDDEPLVREHVCWALAQISNAR